MSKKSFYLFHDSLEILNDISDEQAGQLFKAIYKFNIGEQVELDPLLKMCFLPFKNQFIRDLEAYNKKCERNKLNGSKGGRPSGSEITEHNPKNPVGYLEPKESETTQMPHDTDTDTDTDTGNGKDIDNKLFNDFWELYDKKVSRKDAYKKWNKLKPNEIEKIFETLPSFLAKITDKKYQPHPTSYLNQKRWEDELQEQEPIKSPTGYVITPHTHNRNNYYSFDEYIGFCEAKKIEPKITQKEFYAK
jgi:hypothetical protein